MEGPLGIGAGKLSLFSLTFWTQHLTYYVVDAGLKLAMYVAQARLKLSAILLPLSPKCYNDKLSPLCPANNTEPQPRLCYPLPSSLTLGNLTLLSIIFHSTQKKQ